SLASPEQLVFGRGWVAFDAPGRKLAVSPEGGTRAMGKRIRVVTPVISDGFLRQPEQFEPVAGWQTEISHVQIERGPASIESEFDESVAVPDTVAKIIDAEQDGINAVVIDCMGDPGMHAAREAVSIPVLGPGEATMHIASILGHRFSVVTVLSSCIPLMENQ